MCGGVKCKDIMRGPVQIGSLLLVTTFLCLPYPCLCDWVNPYLAGYPSAEDNQKLSVYDGQERGKCVQSSTCQHYMTRFVNLFIRSTGLQGRVVKQPDDIRHVTLQLQLTGWQLRVLQEFGEDESAANDATFESVDRALTEILMQQSTTSEGRWTGGIFADVEWSNILNRVTPLGNIVFFIGSLLVVLSWNLYCSHSLMRTVAYLFLIILLALFGYGCYEKHLIKIAKVKAAQMKYEGSIPVECTPSRMRFWNMFVNNLRNDDVCEKYFIDVEVPILSLADVGGSFRDAVRLIFFETLGGVGSMLSMTIQSLAEYCEISQVPLAAELHRFPHLPGIHSHLRAVHLGDLQMRRKDMASDDGVFQNVGAQTVQRNQIGIIAAGPAGQAAGQLREWAHGTGTHQWGENRAGGFNLYSLRRGQQHQDYRPVPDDPWQLCRQKDNSPQRGRCHKLVSGSATSAETQDDVHVIRTECAHVRGLFRVVQCRIVLANSEKKIKRGYGGCGIYPQSDVWLPHLQGTTYYKARSNQDIYEADILALEEFTEDITNPNSAISFAPLRTKHDQVIRHPFYPVTYSFDTFQEYKYQSVSWAGVLASAVQFAPGRGTGRTYTALYLQQNISDGASLPSPATMAKRKAAASAETSPATPQVPVSNSFELLANAPEIVPDAPKKEFVPPIVLNGKPANITQFITDTRKVTEHDIRVRSNGRNTKIIVASRKDYQKVYDLYKERNVQFFSFAFKDDHLKRFVLHDLPETFTPEVILAELKRAIPSINSVSQMTKKLENGSTRKLPLFIVTAKKDVTIQSFSQVRAIFYHEYKVEKFRSGGTNVVQCYKCQNFGHTNRFCNMPERCVRCGQAHSAKECKETILKCPNCSENHSAGSLNCKVRHLYIQRNVSRNSPKKVERVPAATVPPITINKRAPAKKVTEGLSFSEVLGGTDKSTRPAQVNSPTAPSVGGHSSAMSDFIKDMQIINRELQGLNLLQMVSTLKSLLIELKNAKTGFERIEILLNNAHKFDP
ncbi:hypothetical protein AAG570_004896 [Ranatra chinensis]|uniref:CCHC-type domain-containing protein n=1 Tax=Ranatra chinensis TaxID=642074 RepID=A0ABD0XYV5_9HEMI